MSRFAIAMTLCAGLLAACATAPAPEPGVDGAAADSEEPFDLAIEAERYSYLVTLAHEGAIEGPPAMTAPDPSDLERAAGALHYAARELYMLRDRVCQTGLAGPDDCGPLPPPDWFGEPVEATPDAEEIRRRIDWLTSVMWPFVDAGCDAGQSRQEEAFPPYCSVE